MLSRLLPDFPKVTLHKTSDGYEIRDNEKNMKMSLSFDNYNKILIDNKKHQLNKIFKIKNLNILDCTGGFARDAAILSSLGNEVTLIERLGTETVVELSSTSGKKFRFATHESIELKTGERVSFNADASKAHLF